MTLLEEMFFIASAIRRIGRLMKLLLNEWASSLVLGSGSPSSILFFSFSSADKYQLNNLMRFDARYVPNFAIFFFRIICPLVLFDSRVEYLLLLTIQAGRVHLFPKALLVNFSLSFLPLFSSFLVFL